MTSDFKSQVLSVIKRYQMLESGDTVIAGLSGGADSMALVSVLNSIKSEYNLRIIAAHVNHGLRGEEALRDEQFAGDFCKSLGIEYRVLHADVPALAAASGESFEACGRNVRYDFLASIAKDVAESSGNAFEHIKIATAHNAQDTVETLIFNLARGTGLKGLSGIPPKRSFAESGSIEDLSSLEIIRPLIESTREEIEEYLFENGISFVTDSTNLETAYARNRIRLNILPELEKLNAGAVRNIARCAASLRTDDAYLSEQADLLMSKSRMGDAYDTRLLCSASVAVCSRAISTILYNKSGVRQEKQHIDSVYDMLSGGGATQVAGGLYVSVRNGLLEFPPIPSEAQDFDEIQTEICLKTPEFTDNFLGAEVRLAVRSYSEYMTELEMARKINTEKYKEILENSLDYGKIPNAFILRNRREGDKFRLPKRRITKTLKNLFNETKVPTADRSRILILESNGEIAFLEGFGASESCLVTNDTEEVLTIEIVRRYKNA